MRSEGKQDKKKERNWGAFSAILLVGMGVVWLVQLSGMGVSKTIFIPLLLASVGIAIVWQQADHSILTATDPSVSRWLQPFVGGGRLGAILRVIIGLGLVGSAMAIVAVARIGLSQLPVVFLLAVFMIVAALIVAAPWLHRWRHSLREARDEKLLADARADMAAHLHDSVLQTLALIQRQAGDPKAVAALARRQERELRTWLYGETANHATVKAALQEAAAEVEDERGTSIEVVCVGDAPMTTNLMALVNASREAMVNAAKHSGADVIDVYAEVSETEIEVFIRDRGMGFDLTEIADDRMGVRGSIIERMERHGGKASIRSAPGEGTEVRLEMKR